MVAQADRRAATRSRLLEASMDCLVEQGHVAFTTTDVVRRSGCSRGALFDHFPSKDDLLAATIEHLFDELRDDYEARFRRLRPAQRTLRRALRLLTDLFDDPRLLAAYGLYTAARTDQALRAALEPVVLAHNKAIYDLAVTLPLEGASALPPGVDLHGLAALAIFSLQGLAVQGLAQDVGADRRALLAALEAFAPTA